MHRVTLPCMLISPDTPIRKCWRCHVVKAEDAFDNARGRICTPCRIPEPERTLRRRERYWLRKLKRPLPIRPVLCPVLGIPMGMGQLDRIDSSLGYVAGNVSWLSARANRLKSDGTAAEHEAIARYMRARGVG